MEEGERSEWEMQRIGNKYAEREWNEKWIGEQRSHETRVKCTHNHGEREARDAGCTQTRASQHIRASICFSNSNMKGCESAKRCDHHTFTAGAQNTGPVYRIEVPSQKTCGWTSMHRRVNRKAHARTPKGQRYRKSMHTSQTRRIIGRICNNTETTKAHKKSLSDW